MRGDHVRRRLTVALILSMVLLHVSLVGAATALQKITFVFSGFNERTSFIFVAKDRHFFEEQGLEAQIVQVRNGPVAVSAMAANEAQFYTTSATGSTLGSMAGGLDLVFVAGIINKLDGDFVVSPKIAVPTDLKGKSLGVQSIGGGVGRFRCSRSIAGGSCPSATRSSFVSSAINR